MTIGYGLLVDYDYCTGCHTCEVACRKALDLGTAERQMGVQLSAHAYEPVRPVRGAHGCWQAAQLRHALPGALPVLRHRR